MTSALLFFVLAASAAACGATSVEEARASVATANNKFALALFDQLTTSAGAGDDAKPDVLFSPLGVHTLLSMLYQGAEGKTKEALGEALQVKDPSVAADGYSQILASIDGVRNVTLFVANRVFVQADVDLKPAFSDALQTRFGSSIEHVDFGEDTDATAAVNDWVNKETHGKIPQLFQRGDFTEDTSIALVNAVFFKGGWKHPFDKYNTRTESFNVDQETQIDVQMMHTTISAHYKNDFELNARILQLPLLEDGVSMYFILPFDKYELEAVEANIKKQGLERIFQELKADEDLHVAIPKFKLVKQNDFERALKQIGLEELFDKDLSELSNIGSAQGNLHVSLVKQKVSIEINEKGATVPDDAVSSASTVYVPRLEEQFYVDEPFLIILKQGDNIVFYGKVVKPIPGDSTKARPGHSSHHRQLASYMRCLDKNKYFKVADIYQGCNVF